jgi:YD repeat-containing protein
MRGIGGADGAVVVRQNREVLMHRKLPTFVLAAAVLVSAAPLAAADHSVTVTGTISKIQASSRSLSVTLPDGTEARFVWNADTKITGTLMTGAKATIRYSPGPDGRNVALQITVVRG